LRTPPLYLLLPVQIFATQPAELAALEEAGIHYDQVTRQLQDEGVQKFVDSFRTLFAGIDNKRKVLHR
jgi:transaldolase